MRNKTDATLAKVDRSYRLYTKAGVRLPVAERKRFPRVTTVSCTLRRHCYIESYNQCYDAIW